MPWGPSLSTTKVLLRKHDARQAAQEDRQGGREEEGEETCLGSVTPRISRSCAPRWMAKRKQGPAGNRHSQRDRMPGLGLCGPHRCRPRGTGKAGSHAGCGPPGYGLSRFLRTGAGDGLSSRATSFTATWRRRTPQDIVSRTAKKGEIIDTVPLHGPCLRQKRSRRSPTSPFTRPRPVSSSGLHQARRPLLHRRLHCHRRLQGDCQDPQGIQTRRPSSPRSRPRAFAAAAAPGSPRAASGRRPTRRPAMRST